LGDRTIVPTGKRPAATPLDNPPPGFHTGDELQLSVRNGHPSVPARARLADLRPGEAGVLDAIDLPEDDARRLMELGFLPGSLITAARRSPFGDPRLFRVDGSEIAIRRETAQHLTLRTQTNGA
jgi:ferrous iron transport protein A